MNKTDIERMKKQKKKDTLDQDYVKGKEHKKKERKKAREKN